MQEPDPQSTICITNDKEEENIEEEVNFHSPLHPHRKLIMAGKKVDCKLILFELQVSQSLQDQETTPTYEGVTEQEVCAQEISSATTLQITITSTKEKAQDIPADEKQETVIPDKETVNAGTNNPVINTEVKKSTTNSFQPTTAIQGL